MTSIFYDLETTDTSYLGQILNYSFIVVDDNFNVVDELSGLIRVSRLQLPTLGAILANRVHLLQHQEDALDTEKIAAKKIVEFLTKTLQNAQTDVRLIGYNSTKFDLPYLRTTLIRNGLDPYIKVGYGKSQKKLLNGDLLSVARKLVTSNEEFALITLYEDPATNEIRRHITLQHLAQQLGLLDGAQTHESRDDVLLTIQLAKTIKERFGIDVRSYCPYEGKQFHPTARTGEVFVQRVPQYDTAIGYSYAEVPVALLDYAGSSTLWIDLLRYEAGNGVQSIVWKNPNDGAFFVDTAPSHITGNFRALAEKALQEFSSVSTQNYFTRSTCDIEGDIYRLDFDERDAMQNAIWNGDVSRAKMSQAVQTLLSRHKLANYIWGSGYDDKVEKLLKEYAIYRYAGDAVVVKSFHSKAKSSLSSNFSPYHPSLPSMVADIKSKIKDQTKEEKDLLDGLYLFYKTSDLIRVSCDHFNLEFD